ncbi:MAG TPA: hypothetical protein PKY12_03485 [Catalimonadaceae bacterium]|nr:hypothetical protein [Catalimonadaceae bacterium]
MRHNLLFILIVLMLGSCQSIGFLPKPRQVGVWPYGGMIVGRDSAQTLVRGELIAIDSGKIYVLTQKSNSPNRTLEIYPIGKFHFHKLQYANKTDRMSLAIPISIVASFAGGYFAVFTIPINLATTRAVSASGKRDYEYTEKNRPANLQAFARFPQGIPKGISLSDIH